MHADEQAFLAINRALSGDAATALFSALTWLGNGAVLAAIIAPALFAFARPALKRHLLPMVLAVAAGGLAVYGIKIAVDRPRPPIRFAAEGIAVHAPLGVPPDPSFPSGHAQTAFGAATYLALLFPRRGWPCLLPALLVGLSRIALGVHYPGDVLAGAVVGSAFAIAGFLIARRIGRRVTAARA